jgi:L-lactate dehydrogenase (cytochrome)
MRLTDCHSIKDFRSLAQKRLPGPLFHYIDGAADDEVTRQRNTDSFNACDLVPNVLAGVDQLDMSTTVMGRKVDMPLMLSPTALQRLFHWRGERAVGAGAQAFNTWFGISSLATVSIEEVGRTISAPKMFQLYVHKDDGLNRALIDRCKAAKFDALALTVDTIVGGNRERCLHTGFTTPMRLTFDAQLRYPSALADRLSHP